MASLRLCPKPSARVEAARPPPRARRAAAAAAAARNYDTTARPPPTAPEDALELLLTLFRKGDAASLASLLPAAAACAARAGGAAALTRVGGREVAEAGTLAALAAVLDVGARRVLPGHLLRRSQALSALALGPDRWAARTALTACTGEEAVIEWQLVRRAPAGGDGDAATLLGAWVLESAARSADGDGDGDAGGAGGATLPAAPHQRLGPEAAALAQLAALGRGDVLAAARWNLLAGRLCSAAPGELGAATSAAHAAGWAAFLERPPCAVLVGHAGARLGAAALASQRTQLQEVRVAPAGGGAEAAFLFRMELASSGTWMVGAIERWAEGAAL
jgi:hypothetical protein